MARSSALPPNRSISLPSRLHPTSLRVEAELNRLRVWEATSSTSAESLTAETIQTGLVGLAELYVCVEELVYSSLTQQALVSHKDGKVLEDALDDSVKLLDACGVARDLLLKTKEHGQCLQSTLRRRGLAESSFEVSISSYIRFRKKAKKEASKCIRELKRVDRKFVYAPLLNVDHHLVMVVKVLREVNAMTSLVFRSILLFLSSQANVSKSRHGGCSLISSFRPTEKPKKIMNEVGVVDDALFCVLDGTEEIQMAQRKLERFIICIDNVEAGLDIVFRRLIHYRVSILNVLTR